MNGVDRGPWTVNRIGAFVRLFLFLFITVHGTRSTVHAASKNTGTKNGNFLKIATDARGVVLGNLMTSMANGAAASRWNPAGLALTELREVTGTHVQYYQDVKIENVSYAHPIGEGGLGANLFYLSPGTLDGRDILGNKTGGFDFYDMSASLGYGHKIFSRSEGADIYLGGQVKMVHEKIADRKFQNPALDVGVMVSPLDRLMTGLAVRNFASSKAKFPREITASASFSPPWGFLKGLEAGLGLNYSNDAPVRYTIGGEYRMAEYYNTAFRAAYQNTDDLDDSEDSGIKGLRSAGIAGLRFGAGFEYRFPIARELRLGLDYAMAPFGALGISHTFTVRARF